MNKKLLLLLGAYIGGVSAALVYNKKTPGEIKKELEISKTSNEKNFKVLFNNFIEIHQNLLDDLKVKFLTDENKKYFNEKKDEFLSLIDDYKIKSQEIFEEYKIAGSDYASEGLEKLEKFYNEKLQELDKFKDKAPEKIQDAKNKLLGYFEEIKGKMKK